MLICQLHLYLYGAADKRNRVRWNPVRWQKDLGLSPEVDAEELVNVLIEAGLCHRQEEFLILLPWPAGQDKGHLVSKGEQMQESVENRAPLISPHYLHLDARQSRRCPVSKARVLEGLTWEGVDRDYRLFVEAFPTPTLRPWSVAHAYPFWQRLQRHGELPSLGVLLHHLKANPPRKPYNTPLTWLRQRFWSEAKPDFKEICPSCLGERVVYASKEDGSKGAVPCQLCKATGVVKLDRRLSKSRLRTP